MQGKSIGIELLERASQLYVQSGNYSEVARKLNVPESTIRHALQRHTDERREDVSKRAVARGLRQGSALMLSVIAQSKNQIEAANSDPKELSIVTGTLSRAMGTLLAVSEHRDKKKQAKLTRKKTKEEINFFQLVKNPKPPDPDALHAKIAAILRDQDPLYDLRQELYQAIEQAQNPNDAQLQAKIRAFIEKQLQLGASSLDVSDDDEPSAEVG